MNDVYVVTYLDYAHGKRPTVSVFDNRQAAADYASWLIGKYDCVAFDVCPVQHEFMVFEPDPTT